MRLFRRHRTETTALAAALAVALVVSVLAGYPLENAETGSVPADLSDALAPVAGDSHALSLDAQVLVAARTPISYEDTKFAAGTGSAGTWRIDLLGGPDTWRGRSMSSSSSGPQPRSRNS